MKNKIKTLVFVMCALVFVLATTSCTKKKIITIEANQTAFVILLSNTNEQAAFESAEILAESKVAAKQVTITSSLRKTGAFSWTRVPDSMLIVVDRVPETREWSSTSGSGTSTKDQAIYAESKESIGFSVGMNCSAQIYSESDAVLFLYSYNNKSLADIMDTEIRARVESKFGEESGKYEMADIIKDKAVIMNAVREDVIPYFAEKGITITTLGIKDGIEYDDPSVQTAINASFTAERLAEAQAVENKMNVDKQNAENEAILSKAKADAEAIRISAEAQAEANKKIADSLNDRLLNKLKYEQWDGKLPTISTNSDSSFIIDIGE